MNHREELIENQCDIQMTPNVSRASKKRILFSMFIHWSMQERFHLQKRIT